MIILIDAYNVFKTVLHVQFISDAQRIRFLTLFVHYAQLRPSNEVILVFDGGQNFYEDCHDYKSITMMYAGAQQSADDVIKKRLVSYQGRDILLVTCDRELRRYAMQYNIESLGSLEFYNMVYTIVHQRDTTQQIKTQALCKTTQDDNQEVDSLMEQASRRLLHKDHDKDKKLVIAFNAFTQSKKDKKLLKKIVKI